MQPRSSVEFERQLVLTAIRSAMSWARLCSSWFGLNQR